MLDWEIFIEAMRRHIPPNCHLLAVSVPGDPDKAGPNLWWAKRYKRWDIEERFNVYVTIGAFKLDDDGKLRRKDSTCVGMTGIVFDDLGTGKGSKGKVTVEEVKALLPPTADIETSLGNHQLVYLFDCLMDDFIKFRQIIAAIIDKFFGGKDPGMQGLTRVFRPGVGRNLKPKYKTEDGIDWEVGFAELDVTRRYKPEEIVKAMGLKLVPIAEKEFVTSRTEGDKDIRAERFRDVVKNLRRMGMIQSRPGGNFYDKDGWVRCDCPFADGDEELGIEPHTGGVQTGAQIRQPNQENDYFGSFVCFHSHGQQRTAGGKPNDLGWKHLVRWLDRRITDELALTNLAASQEGSYWDSYFNQE